MNFQSRNESSRIMMIRIIEMPTVRIISFLIVLALETLPSGLPWARTCASGCSSSNAILVFWSIL